MKTIPLLALTLLASPALAAEPAAKRPLDVRANASDETTTKFAGALRDALPASERMRAPTGEDEDDLSLVIANVTPDKKKFGWSIDLLKVNANFTPSRVGSFTGKCRADELAKCARNVIADADRAVRKAEKD